MAGELWRQYFQIGKESTPGTGVAATRRMYFNLDDSKFGREREARPHKFAAASRDNVRAFTLGSNVVSGTIKMPLSSSELIELLLMTVNGGVSGVLQTAAYLWAFTPGTTLDPTTIEWQDGARAREASGCYGNKLKLSGSVDGANEVEIDVFAMGLEEGITMTPALAERTPDFIIEGWKTKLFVDAFEGAPGTTQITGTLINWDVQLENNLNRKYFAANTQDAGSIPIGELMVSAKLTFEAASAQAATELTNWDAATKRLVRLDFGNNEVIAGSEYKFVTVDIPGAWNSFDLGGSDKGTRTYELGVQYVYDPTNAFGLQIRAQNDRSTAW